MRTPRELKALYERGQNITQLLREDYGVQENTREIIEIAYDLQSGSYIAALENSDMAEHKAEYSQQIAKTILSLCTPTSVLEAGVGEGTTLSGVLRSLDPNISSYGFDLSWSRAFCAQRWLEANDLDRARLCTGDLMNIPYADNAFDVVYTSHSIEPNGGMELPILQELHRVTKKYLILLEPAYEFASRKAQIRMDTHGYCKKLREVAESLNYSVLSHEPFPLSANPLNPTAITIIEKQPSEAKLSSVYACPKLRCALREFGNVFYSPDALLVYPIIEGIPCLRIENGILASKFDDLV
ncbi:MAG: methyltransferase domain-containing protein [Pseudomonadota bacterium]